MIYEFSEQLISSNFEYYTVFEQLLHTANYQIIINQSQKSLKMAVKSSECCTAFLQAL